jgi:hypothetical protein
MPLHCSLYTDRQLRVVDHPPAIDQARLSRVRGAGIFGPNFQRFSK